MVNYIDPNYLHLDKLPSNIKISTISATCYLGTNILLKEINDYLKLDIKKIFTIKYNNCVKSLEPQKKKKAKKKSFQNQMTVEVKPDLDQYPDSKLSIKIFKNGSIQMSGIKNIQAVNTGLTKLLNELKKEYGIPTNIDGENNMKIIKFIEDSDKLSISNFKIDMINSGFTVNYEINRENLYLQLLKNNIECKFEPSIHAGVNIKYYPKDLINKKVSLFVFESGNIIITGAKNIDNIIDSYNYISKYLADYKSKVQKSKISVLLKNNINKEVQNMITVNKDDDLLQLALNDI